MSRERINVDPDAPQGHETYGTPRTLYGRRVVEMHSEFYLSENLRFEAVRYSGFIGMPRGGWLVRPRFNGESSDPIATKREAIELLAEWSAEHAAKSAVR
jgi:hypothetical protein